MEIADSPQWHPDEQIVARARLTSLQQRLGVPSYDELLALSQDDPERYWAAVMNDLDWRWRSPYATFLRQPRGPAFAEWFAQGKLNWVDNLRKWSADEARTGQAALISESEDGHVCTLSYAQLDSEIRRVAAGLLRQGLARGDCVGLMLPMGQEAVVALVALSAIGAIAVPLFTGYGAEAVISRLSAAGACGLIASATLQRRGKLITTDAVVNACRTALPQLRHVWTVGSDSWDALRDAPPVTDVEAIDADAPFMIVFTSGTTGKPKGTVHTHAGFALKVTHDAAYLFDFQAGDRCLWPSDMGWVVGALTTVSVLSLGGTLVCYDGAPDFPTPHRLFDLIRRHEVTHFGASPTLIRGLASHGHPPEAPPSLRLLMAAGEVLDREHFEWYLRHLGRGSLPVINYTGGTEASGALLSNVVVRPIKSSAFNSVSPGVSVHAVDDRGRRVRGTVGELAVTAPFVGMTRSFWNDDARYLESYWSQRPGIWMHGDLLMEDADGHFYILGRADDTLKIAGKRVGPAEVEAVVLRALPVREVAAIGLPDAVKGQRLVVCAVAQDGASPAPLTERLCDAVEAALGRPFRPAEVLWLTELPRTRNAKVMRRVIRRVLSGEAPGDLSSLENPAAIVALAALQGSLK
jgi:acetyl-CoA synthetase